MIHNTYTNYNGLLINLYLVSSIRLNYPYNSSITKSNFQSVQTVYNILKKLAKVPYSQWPSGTIPARVSVLHYQLSLYSFSKTQVSSETLRFSASGVPLKPQQNSSTSSLGGSGGPLDAQNTSYSKLIKWLDKMK